MNDHETGDGCVDGASPYGTDYRIAQSVLEAIVRGAVATDPALQVHQGSRFGRTHVIGVIVEGSSCRVSVAVDARLGDPLPVVAGDLQGRVRRTLEDTTGLTVEAVDVTIVSVVPPRGSA